MSREVIPQKVTVICDGCGMNDREGSFRMGATVSFKGSALDVYGCPAAPADFIFDLCDTCAVEFFNKWRSKVK